MIELPIDLTKLVVSELAVPINKINPYIQSIIIFNMCTVRAYVFAITTIASNLFTSLFSTFSVMKHPMTE